MPLSGPHIMPSSGSEPKQLVILIHGYGADGNDLINLAPSFSDLMPEALFIAPNAPTPCEVSPYGYQWFSLPSVEPNVIEKGLNTARPVLESFIEECMQTHNITPKNVFLIGFSQGAMLSLEIAMQYPQKLGGVVAYSGGIIHPERFAHKTETIPPLCIIHGQMDMVVPFMFFEHTVRYLKTLDITMESHAEPFTGHGISPAGINNAKQFLASLMTD